MSVSYSHSRDTSPRRTYEEQAEVELMRERLKKFEIEKHHEEEQKRIRDELLLKQAKEAEERRKEEQKQKEIKEKAIEEFKRKEAEKLAKEKVEKEAKEREYQDRYRKDLEKLGFSNRDVSLVVKREVDLSKTTYTKMARRHISIETLRTYNVDWKFDHDPEYVIIKRWVPEHEQEVFWEHTRHVRESRANEERHQYFMRMQEEERARRILEEQQQQQKKKKAARRTGFW
ncbi:hypothetical protein GP486_005403 [Trichoglossum hirsutum]|uniref:DUF8035 domain-containing protein n=1 Tax=Trichoglossum hirsutum TaxID=265104 RepID=A0A9P8L961_9PEZI|nr:hypothetical protein GP486_005403 [Trichoglossum hirsutum]